MSLKTFKCSCFSFECTTREMLCFGITKSVKKESNGIVLTSHGNMLDLFI